ncbi:hypothetical protein [Saccharothrix syringae]|uniref:Uncharacterized protein n=1 Tax=Saccharothrix syringae TaxID=103733 RepID=A0A5Q0H7H9_SACSY|nr:hypothetical protein [Saccharothrix syringae]QFZ21924.1 hypothetical protein EKG83_35005 [Saccharothrix syringae]
MSEHEPPPQSPRPPQPAAEQPAEPVPPPVAPRPATRAGFGRFARHRATQLVAVGLLGLVLGAGIVALAGRDGHRPGNAQDRPGTSRFDDRGPGRGDFDRRERPNRGEHQDRQDRPDRGER